MKENKRGKLTQKLLDNIENLKEVTLTKKELEILGAKKNTTYYALELHGVVGESDVSQYLIYQPVNHKDDKYCLRNSIKI